MSFHEVITVAEKIENTVQPVFGLDFHTSTFEDIDRRGSPTWSARAELSGD